MIFLGFKIIILISLLRILDITQNPFLCSGIYGFIVFILNFMFGNTFFDSLLFSLVSFALATLYFWLLARFNDGFPYWGIMIGGLVIGLV